MNPLQLPLAHPSLDPDTAQRSDPALLGALLARETTRIVALDEAGRAALEEGSLAYLPASEWLRAPLLAYLGKRHDGAAIVLAVGPARPELTYGDIRRVATHLDEPDRGVAIPALALANWHHVHPFCPRCGSATEVVAAGWVRRCRACAVEHFPRMDPAVIMAVLDCRGRILLAHAAHFTPGRYSTIAGYVEPGECLEHAVARETLEETGLTVTSATYRGSQPWPFPRSLMFAFTAKVAGSPEVRVDGQELEDARFFSREELGRAVRAGRVRLPGRASVAHALIADWYGGPLPENPPDTGSGGLSGRPV